MKTQKGFAVTTIVGIIALFIVLGGGAYVYTNQQEKGGEEEVVCTSEAKLCSDGSSVGRAGPDCEFAECSKTTQGGGKPFEDVCISAFEFEPQKDYPNVGISLVDHADTLCKLRNKTREVCESQDQVDALYGGAEQEGFRDCLWIRLEKGKKSNAQRECLTQGGQWREVVVENIPQVTAYCNLPVIPHGITVESPLYNEPVIFPVRVKGFVNGNGWFVNEGEAGTVQIFDSNDKAVSNVVILDASDDWLDITLAGKPVPFEALVGDRQMITYLETDIGYLLFKSTGAKDDDVILTYRLPVRLRKSALGQESNLLVVSLGEEFTLHEGDAVEIDNTGLEVTITKFYNSPCPTDVQCFWSGVGIGFEYNLDGETISGIDRVQAFGFRTTVVETDYETYADLIVVSIE